MSGRRPPADRLELAAPAIAALLARAAGHLPAPLRARVLRSAFDRARDAFNRGDFEVVFALFEEHVEYGPPPPLHDAAVIRGRAAVLDFWRDVAERFDTSSIENLSLEEAGPRRFVRRARLRHTPRGGGEALEYVILQTTELERGRVVRQLNPLEQ